MADGGDYTRSGPVTAHLIDDTGVTPIRFRHTWTGLENIDDVTFRPGSVLHLPEGSMTYGIAVHMAAVEVLHFELHDGPGDPLDETD